MINEIEVSVVIPTYGRPETLERAINSVLSQTYQKFEIIIVDDNEKGSNVKEMTQKLVHDLMMKDRRISLVDHGGNIGYAAARNSGASDSKGEYLAFLDDDDEWFPQKLEQQVALIEASKSIGLVYCRSINVRKDGTVYKYSQENLPSGYIYKELLWKDFIGASSKVLIRTRYFKELGGLDETFLTRGDHDLFLRLSKKYEVALIDKNLVKFYIDGSRISRNIPKKLQGWRLFINKWKDELEKIPDCYENTLYRFYTEIGKIYYIKKEYVKALNWFVKSLKIRPINFKNYIFTVLCMFRIPPKTLRLK